MEHSLSAPPPSPATAMSFDIEDWFHVENLKHVVARETWDHRELRVERSTDRLLEMTHAAGARCTCFVLGWVAEKLPQLVRRIAAAGHEVASHGYGHELVYRLSPEAFRADVERAKKTLEDLVGQPVRGYRAPSFSITDWAVPILQETGHRYDSSAFPTALHDRYGRLAGVPAGRAVFEIRPGFHEVSLSCLKLGGRGLPWAGGGYFRLLPYPLFRAGIQSILGSGTPYVFYLHPWEIDPAQPRPRGLRATYRWRHYLNLERCQERLKALLADFRWSPLGDLVGNDGTAAPV